MRKPNLFEVVGAGAVLIALSSCGDDPVEQTSEGMGTDNVMTTSATSSTTDTPDPETTVAEPKLDTPDQIPTGCQGDGFCDQIDLLFVVDNSGTMGEEQLNLAKNFPLLVDRLKDLRDSSGSPVNPDVNIMVTTTDMGHPLCTPFQRKDYTPRQGAPIYRGCNQRIARFTGLEPQNPTVVEDACTANCPVDIAPGGTFISFNPGGSNVPNDDIGAALSCIGPQGIDGCGYEAPLESMLQAINPDSCWNNPEQDICDNDPEWESVSVGFLRPNALLAIAIITDEVDCSVSSPGGFSFFTAQDDYWEINPAIKMPQASSAVCWNAGVECSAPDGNGVYETCTAAENGVLHPVDRYTSYLSWLRESQNKEIVMLGILGVPPVERDEMGEVVGGGVDAVEYRDWRDGEYDGTPGGGDVLPDEWAAGRTAADKRFEFGNIGPGCTGTDGLGGFTGQAIPPVRIRDVCESLNYEVGGELQQRCCIESICDSDFSPAVDCLTEAISGAIVPG